LGEIKAIEKEGLDKIGGYKKMYQDMLDDIKDSSRVLKKAINV
jgi:hypothetical protein